MNDKRQQSATAGAREAALAAAALATPAPMTSTPSLSGPEAGDNVECNGAARHRRQLGCATCSGGIRIIASCLHDQQSRARPGSIDRQPDRQTARQKGVRQSREREGEE